MSSRSHTTSLVIRAGLLLAAIAGITFLGRHGALWPTPASAGETIDVVCQPTYLNDSPQDIPDNTTTGITSTVTINMPGHRITLFKVRINSIKHPFVGDLRLRLITPNQTVITLIGNPGVFANDGDDFFGTTLQDASPTSILNGVAPFTGGFHPVEPLAPLVGQPLSGVWQLNVSDVAPQDVGVLESWALEVCSLQDRIWLPAVLR